MVGTKTYYATAKGSINQDNIPRLFRYPRHIFKMYKAKAERTKGRNESKITVEMFQYPLSVTELNSIGQNHIFLRVPRQNYIQGPKNY